MKSLLRTAILFDWDGTLLNSFPASYRASITVLEHYGIDIDRERFLETYSPNWYESYEKLGVPREEWDNADQMWRRTYRNQVSEPFPFVGQLLELAPVEVVAGLGGIHALAIVETGEPTLELRTRVGAQAQCYEAGFGGVELQGPVGRFESRVEEHN